MLAELLYIVASSSDNYGDFFKDPWNFIFSPYTQVFNPFPAIFWLTVIGSFTMVVGMKTRHPAPPFIVLIMGSFLVAPLVGAFGWIFRIVAGVGIGAFLYLMLRRGRH